MGLSYPLRLNLPPCTLVLPYLGVPDGLRGEPWAMAPGGAMVHHGPVGPLTEPVAHCSPGGRSHGQLPKRTITGGGALRTASRLLRTTSVACRGLSRRFQGQLRVPPRAPYAAPPDRASGGWVGSPCWAARGGGPGTPAPHRRCPGMHAEGRRARTGDAQTSPAGTKQVTWEGDQPRRPLGSGSLLGGAGRAPGNSLKLHNRQGGAVREPQINHTCADEQHMVAGTGAPLSEPPVGPARGAAERPSPPADPGPCPRTRTPFTRTTQCRPRRLFRRPHAHADMLLRLQAMPAVVGTRAQTAQGITRTHPGKRPPIRGRAPYARAMQPCDQRESRARAAGGDGGPPPITCV